VLKRKSKRVLSIVLAVAMIVGLFPIAAFADEGTTTSSDAIAPPTASNDTIFANGTPITITETAPEFGEAVTFPDLAKTGTAAYISWQDNGTTKYVGVSRDITVVGGKYADENAVSVPSTSITMTGGTVNNIYGGNYGMKDNESTNTSTVTGDVTMNFSDDAVVLNLLHGGGRFNTNVQGTVYMNFNNVKNMNDKDSDIWPYINGGVYGNGSEGSRDIANGKMNTNAVVNNVEINATNSNLYLLGAGGSGSTKVKNGKVTLNKCTLTSLFLGGINGEVENSTITAEDCTITDFAATNRGFVGTGEVSFINSTITNFQTGANEGCFASDSGTPDGSGVTQSVTYHIDSNTTITNSLMTPYITRETGGTFQNSFKNVTIDSEKPLNMAISKFQYAKDVYQTSFSVPEDSTLTLNNVQLSIADNNTLENIGTIKMDNTSSITIPTGATLKNAGTISGTVNGEIDQYVARVNGVGYDTLEKAIKAAAPGDTITLVNNVEMDSQINLPDNTTLDGAGHTLTYTGTTENISGGAFNITNDNVTINDLTINAAGLKHGVRFYCTKGGELNGVTVNGGIYTSVIVNGATNVDIIDCVLNPAKGAYTNIEYAMGSNVNIVPSMNINNVTFDNSKSAVWADKATTGRVEDKMGGDQTNEAILAEILDNITYTSPNGGSLAIAVGFSDNSTLVGYEESTYQPPYTGKYSYEIFTTVGDNGAIDVDRYATEGDDVTITVSPDEAYLLDELTVTANGKEVEVKDNGDGTYTFKMPSADAKIVVTFAEDPNWEPEPEEPAMPFTDVNEGDWFYDVVLYAYDNGLMTGVSATEFAPNQTTTRGMIVSMLARLEGVTNAEDAGFADVAANDWYATAVNWAASVGVVNGYEDNTFRPNAAITREQMAAILYNYADYKGYDVSARADLSDYADAASISSWAEDVLAWANAEGLINGMTATTIDPQGATTRAQTAAMFERFLTAHEA
jgi:hypothetical protein